MFFFSAAGNSSASRVATIDITTKIVQPHPLCNSPILCSQISFPSFCALIPKAVIIRYVPLILLKIICSSMQSFSYVRNLNLYKLITHQRAFPDKNSFYRLRYYFETGWSCSAIKGNMCTNLEYFNHWKTLITYSFFCSAKGQVSS